jgi:hypothetical protein
MIIEIITQAKFVKQGDATPGCLQIKDTRFFSLSPKDEKDATKINSDMLYAANYNVES